MWGSALLCKGPRFGSLHLHGTPQSPATQEPGDLTPFCVGMCDTGTHPLQTPEDQAEVLFTVEGHRYCFRFIARKKTQVLGCYTLNPVHAPGCPQTFHNPVARRPSLNSPKHSVFEGHLAISAIQPSHFSRLCQHGPPHPPPLPASTSWEPSSRVKSPPPGRRQDFGFPKVLIYVLPGPAWLLRNDPCRCRLLPP